MVQTEVPDRLVGTLRGDFKAECDLYQQLKEHCLLVHDQKLKYGKLVSAAYATYARYKMRREVLEHPEKYVDSIKQESDEIQAQVNARKEWQEIAGKGKDPE